MRSRLEDACVLVGLGFCTGYAFAFGYWIAGCIFAVCSLVSLTLVVLHWRMARRLEEIEAELERLQGKGPKP